MILIDDLDRCRPESVVEMLEAVNFLITCGDCYIVLGMARERVERCVGLAFKDMAEEVFGGVAGTDDQKEEMRKQRRVDFARQYLEKLINIEVPVPTATPEQSRALLARDETLVGEQREQLSRARAITRVTAVVMAVVLLLGVAFLSGEWLFPKRVTETKQSTAPQKNSATVPESKDAPQDTSTQRPGPSPDSSPAALDAAVPGARALWTVWPLIAALLAVGIWSSLLVPTNVVYDSVEFTDALRLWQPIISRKRNTPRSLKRFLNRVRYLSMRQRANEPMRTRWTLFRAKFISNSSSAENDGGTPDPEIDEDVLVGLCACKDLFPDKTIRSAIHSVEEALTENTQKTRNPSPEEQELLNYLPSEFADRAEMASEEFEKLYAGLHVY